MPITLPPEVDQEAIWKVIKQAFIENASHHDFQLGHSFEFLGNPSPVMPENVTELSDDWFYNEVYGACYPTFVLEVNYRGNKGVMRRESKGPTYTNVMTITFYNADGTEEKYRLTGHWLRKVERIDGGSDGV